MKTSDIPEDLFRQLVRHAISLDAICEDLKGFHGIEANEARNEIFPSLEQIRNMRQNDVELTYQQWHDFWKIIESGEVDMATARVEAAKRNAEDVDYNKQYPIQQDQDGCRYRVLTDWDGRKYKEYEGW